MYPRILTANKQKFINEYLESVKSDKIKSGFLPFITSLEEFPAYSSVLLRLANWELPSTDLTLGPL